MSEPPGRRLRIIQLASGDLWAGAEAVFYELCRGLAGFDGIDLCAVVLNRARLAAECKAAGINTHVIDESKKGFASIAPQFAGFVRTYRPDIIHSHRYKENILASIATPFSGFPKPVTTVHGMTEIGNNLKSRMISFINDTLMRYAFKRVVTVSVELGERLRSRGIPGNRLACIHNGIYLPDYTTGKKNASGGFVVGSAGRLVSVKDFPLMLDTAATILKDMPSTRFIIAGDGPEKEALKKKAAALGIAGSVEFTGHIDDLETFYKRIDIYVNTSVHEGIPMTILEAMSWGIPVVAPKVGGIPEIITEGKDGLLVEERTASSFAEALSGLIREPSKTALLGAHARSRIEDSFSSRAMAAGYRTLYWEIMKCREKSA